MRQSYYQITIRLSDPAEWEQFQAVAKAAGLSGNAAVVQAMREWAGRQDPPAKAPRKAAAAKE